MRNTSAGYLFDLKTGKIEWTLGGKNSTFALEPDAEFEWQHDIIFDGDKTVTLFDNHCCEITGAGEYLSVRPGLARPGARAGHGGEDREGRRAVLPR